MDCDPDLCGVFNYYFEDQVRVGHLLHKENHFSCEVNENLHKESDFLYKENEFSYEENRFSYEENHFSYKVNRFLHKENGNLHKENRYWIREE